MRASLAAAAAMMAGALCASDACATDESAIVLAPGPERARVQAACSMCHSLDYIVMNSPIQDAAGWDKTVRKMMTVYGAPLTPEESAAIVAYLARHYGT
jgi:anaerobic selenocysteine-containing dehydrogenase